jgi:hypothetical protein
MIEFFLYFVGVPIAIGLVLILAAFTVFIFREKNPKFDLWLSDVWPKETQRSAIVTSIVIVGFLWLVIGNPW